MSQIYFMIREKILHIMQFKGANICKALRTLIENSFRYTNASSSGLGRHFLFFSRGPHFNPLGPHSGPWICLCSTFVGSSSLCLLATAILDSLFLV